MQAFNITTAENFITAITEVSTRDAQLKVITAHKAGIKDLIVAFVDSLEVPPAAKWTRATIDAFIAFVSDAIATANAPFPTFSEGILRLEGETLFVAVVKQTGLEGTGLHAKDLDLRPTSNMSHRAFEIVAQLICETSSNPIAFLVRLKSLFPVITIASLQRFLDEMNCPLRHAMFNKGVRAGRVKKAKQKRFYELVDMIEWLLNNQVYLTIPCLPPAKEMPIAVEAFTVDSAQYDVPVIVPAFIVDSAQCETPVTIISSVAFQGVKRAVKGKARFAPKRKKVEVSGNPETAVECLNTEAPAIAVEAPVTPAIAETAVEAPVTPAIAVDAPATVSNCEFISLTEFCLAIGVANPQTAYKNLGINPSVPLPKNEPHFVSNGFTFEERRAFWKAKQFPISLVEVCNTRPTARKR